MSGQHEVEKWLPVVGYERLYEVSNAGRVRCLDRTEHVRNRWGGITARRRRGKMLKASPNWNGYPAVWLVDDNKNVSGLLVHRLVYMAFVGPIPHGLDVAHNDGSRTNNWVGNLRAATRKENMADKLIHGTLLWGEAASQAKLTADDVRAIRTGVNGLSRKDMAQKYGISKSHVDRLLRLENWRHLHD